MREYVGKPSPMVRFVCVGKHNGVVAYDLVLYEDLDELGSLDTGVVGRQEGEEVENEDEDEDEDNIEHDQLEKIGGDSTDEEYEDEESDDEL
jgi:hypothetical protein